MTSPLIGSLSMAQGPVFNPDELRFSKGELADKMQLLIERWKANPNVNKAIVKKFQLDLLLFKSPLVKNEDLPYAWKMFCELVDELRALNERKAQPVSSALDELAARHFEDKISTFPEQKKEPSKWSLAEVLKKGGMQNG